MLWRVVGQDNATHGTVRTVSTRIDTKYTLLEVALITGGLIIARQLRHTNTETISCAIVRAAHTHTTDVQETFALHHQF